MSLTALPVADAGATRICHEDLAPVVNRFRVRQDASGCVMDPSPEAVQELKSVLQIACEVLERLDLTTQREALELDVRDWLTAGIGTAPRFDRSRDALVPPPDGGTVFFIAPFLTTNGPQPVGRRLDFFLAVREEPKELDALAVAFPHPKNACQSVRLISGSDGILKGNCIVFFPENVQSATPVNRQSYAIFFFNKFHRIYQTHTRGAIADLLGEESQSHSSFSLAAPECYRARCVWGYLHDYFHHQGPRPFDENIAVKLNWYVGLLEEIKVDCQTVIACIESGVPFGREVAEFVIFDRVFRYPLHPEAERNFDAGTGVLFFEYLRSHGVIKTNSTTRVSLDWGQLFPRLRDLVDEIEELERSVSTDDEYRNAALTYVRRYLSPGEANAKYRFTPQQEILRLSTAAHRTLDFETLDY